MLTHLLCSTGCAVLLLAAAALSLYVQRHSQASSSLGSSDKIIISHNKICPSVNRTQCLEMIKLYAASIALLWSRLF